MKPSRYTLQWLWFGLLGCGAQDPPDTLTELLPRGAVLARVDGEPVTSEQVELTARELQLGPREALERAIELQIMVGEARRRGLISRADLGEFAWRARVQRLLEREVESSVRESTFGPEEVARVLDDRAIELRAPATLRVVHFLARFGPRAGEAQRAQALARAADFRRRLVAAAGERPTEGRFNAEALAVGGENNRYESVGPFDERGRTAGGGGLVPEFVAGALSLSPQTPLSGPITTRFGVHIVLLVAEAGPSQRPLEEALAVARRDMVVRGRAEAAQALVERLRNSHRVIVNPESVSSVQSLSRSH